MTQARDTHRGLVRNLKVRNHLEDHDVDERMIVKWILRLG